jgi:hypothetical protein
MVAARPSPFRAQAASGSGRQSDSSRSRNRRWLSTNAAAADASDQNQSQPRGAGDVEELGYVHGSHAAHRGVLHHVVAAAAARFVSDNPGGSYG